MRISDCSSDVCSSDLLGEANADTLRLPAAPYLRSIWLDDAAGLGWARPVDELLARADAPDAPNDALLAAIEKEVAPGDAAVIVYTSDRKSAVEGKEVSAALDLGGRRTIKKNHKYAQTIRVQLTLANSYINNK